MTHWKATNPQGRDFKTGTLDYASAVGGGTVTHPYPSVTMVPNGPSTYLSVSTEPAETLIGGTWPCRLFKVEPIGATLADLSASPHKRACKSLRVIEEVPAWQALGPNGEQVAALIERCTRMTFNEAKALTATWDAAWGATRDAARAAAWGATGFVVADLVGQYGYTQEHHDTLLGPWRAVFGDES